MRNNRKGALPDNRQGSPVLSARQHAAAAQPRPPRTVTYPSVEQAQPPQHLGIHIPHRPDASDHPTDAGHCLTSPPGPNAPTPRRNAPAPFKAHTCRRTPVPTAPTPRTTPPTPEPATRRALPHLTAGTQRSNIPPQLASAIQDTSPPPHNGPHTIPTPRTTPPTPGPAPRRALPRLTAGPQCSNSPSQLARLIQDTPLPPHNGPTPSQPSDHPAGAGFNRTAGHKKIRLCEPDLFICQ